MKQVTCDRCGTEANYNIGGASIDIRPENRLETTRVRKAHRNKTRAFR